MTRRGVVLGGGGVAGIAWETGLLTGLAEGGADVLGAQVYVGTSAGSTVAAQITSGLSLRELFQRQVDPALQASELPADLDLDALMAAFDEALGGAADALDARRRIGAMAQLAPTVSEAERRAVIESRLPSHSWPNAELKIVAVDLETGEERVFDHASGVQLVDAVAASCAVPGTWPPVTIEGRRYIDGGVRSGENADLAEGCDRVLVVQAMTHPEARDLENQVEQLREQGAEVLVIRPDEASLAAIGPNPLDPTVREAAARAGYEQGLREAEATAKLLS
jgi:NTE family protein